MIGEPVGHYDYTSRMHADIAWQTHKAVCDIQNFSPQLILLCELLARFYSKATLDCGYFFIGDAISPSRLADSRSRLKADMIRYSCDMVIAKTFEDRVENGIALVPCEIDIDIGRILAFGVQESLEVEIVADRIDIGNSKAVGHYARSGAPSATGARCPPCNISHC